MKTMTDNHNAMVLGHFIIDEGDRKLNYVVGHIDCTHFYMNEIWDDDGDVSETFVRRGCVYHVGQMHEVATGLYDALVAWLYGDESMNGRTFKRIS